MSSDPDFRFAGIARLYGRAGLARLQSARVLVVGVGGVGSWVVEALARSGIGALTLVDLDEVCVSNINRQLPALESTVGRAKVDVLAERVREIHPGCRVEAVPDFFTAETAARLLDPLRQEPGPVWVVDAIDQVANKVRLIAGCRERGVPVFVCGAAGGRRDPCAVRVEDLARVTHDRLLGEVRKRLRREHGLPRGEKRFRIPAVCSPEPPVYPRSDGTVCDLATSEPVPGETRRLNCDQGYGSATFVTGAFGFAAAGWVVRAIAEAPAAPVDIDAAARQPSRP